ncbi:glycosyltransferase [Thermodesulfobacteriota bacterium]
MAGFQGQVVDPAAVIVGGFPGIDQLVANHEHVAWYKNEGEFFELLDYYLSNADKRNTIRVNAQNLAHGRHTYLDRIKNMMEIIDGRHERFNGFLRSSL